MSGAPESTVAGRAYDNDSSEHPGRLLSVFFVCQAVDRDDPILATTVRWIEELASSKGVDRVTVLAIRTGRHDLPTEIEVRGFGRPGRLSRLVAFYREAARALRRRPDLIFVYQGGPYPLLLLPVKLLRRIPIVQWKAHAVISRSMAFYARWCDDLIFTPNRAAFPMDLSKVRVVGHGIDTERFSVDEAPSVGELITVCRITPIKRIEQMIAAVAHANRAHGADHRFNIYGPTLPGNESYAAQVEAQINRIGAKSWVKLRGPVPQEDLPRLLNGHRAFLNFAGGALDKSAVEAMACGLPVISTNDSFAEALPPDLRPILITDKESAAQQGASIAALLSKPDTEIQELGRRMRRLAVDEHSIDHLFDRIVDEVRVSLWDRR